MEVSWAISNPARRPKPDRRKEGGTQSARLFILPLPHTAVNIDVPEDRKSSGIRQVLCESIATLAFQIRERAQIFKMLYTYCIRFMILQNEQAHLQLNLRYFEAAI